MQMLAADDTFHFTAAQVRVSPKLPSQTMTEGPTVRQATIKGSSLFPIMGCNPITTLKNKM